jgi:hypothetical protein
MSPFQRLSPFQRHVPLSVEIAISLVSPASAIRMQHRRGHFAVLLHGIPFNYCVAAAFQDPCDFAPSSQSCNTPRDVARGSA